MIEILFIFIVVGFAVITHPSSSNRYPTNYSNSTDNTNEISNKMSGGFKGQKMKNETNYSNSTDNTNEISNKMSGGFKGQKMKNEITDIIKIGDEYHIKCKTMYFEYTIILTEEEYLNNKDKIKITIRLKLSETKD